MFPFWFGKPSLLGTDCLSCKKVTNVSYPCSSARRAEKSETNNSGFGLWSQFSPLSRNITLQSTATPRFSQVRQPLLGCHPRYNLGHRKHQTLILLPLCTCSDCRNSLTLAFLWCFLAEQDQMKETLEVQFCPWPYVEKARCSFDYGHCLRAANPRLEKVVDRP